jgi:predicted aldo/keto reductase-like oxidoreductase
MSNDHPLKRREFLQRSAAAAAFGLAGGLSLRVPAAGGQGAVDEAVRKVGRLPRRKFGSVGREVSVLFGAGDLAAAPTEAAILCGVNYWHKSNAWTRDGAPEAIRKNREAHYCQVTVDRIGGNHEAGRIDEESHYGFVTDAVQKTRLGYFDDMQFHYGYHNTAEIKQDRGVVRAFERLKKEGLVKHLCLSQHGYAGNARVPGGESAAEILTALVEDGLYEHAQFIYSYGDDPAMNAFLALARKKGFGTTAMKTARGLGRMRQDKAFMDALPPGTAPHNALVRWLTGASLLDSAVIRVRNLDEFAETFSGAGKSLRPEDAAAIGMMTARADATACRLCTECQPYCPRQVPIAEILRFERYALDDGSMETAVRLYAGLDRRADACAACGSCLSHCPQALPIPDKLAAVHTLLGRPG